MGAREWVTASLEWRGLLIGQRSAGAK